MPPSPPLMNYTISMEKSGRPSWFLYFCHLTQIASVGPWIAIWIQKYTNQEISRVQNMLCKDFEKSENIFIWTFLQNRWIHPSFLASSHGWNKLEIIQNANFEWRCHEYLVLCIIQSGDTKDISHAGNYCDSTQWLLRYILKTHF